MRWEEIALLRPRLEEYESGASKLGQSMVLLPLIFDILTHGQDASIWQIHALIFRQALLDDGRVFGGLQGDEQGQCNRCGMDHLQILHVGVRSQCVLRAIVVDGEQMVEVYVEFLFVHIF